jgi:hypothetical protein
MVAIKPARHGGGRSVLFVLMGWVGWSCATATTTTGGGIEPPAPRSATASAVTAPGAAGACERPDPIFGPVYVAPEAYTSRTGITASTFSGLPTTKQRPLEECGIPAVLRRLVTLKCDDGSNPYGGSLAAAERSRAGNFGPGGRCDSIIDRYDVHCPERTYQVFTDCYICVRPLKQSQMSISESAPEGDQPIRL